MQSVFNFLKNQQLMAIACTDEGGPWIANVYYGIDARGIIYFISPQKNRHSEAILRDPYIAFTVCWFDPSNHKNRKAVQGLGVCRLAKNPTEIAVGVKLLYDKFPDLREILTVKWIMTNIWGSRVWVIEPSYMKYWDDELYGEDESREFNISTKKTL